MRSFHEEMERCLKEYKKHISGGKFSLSMLRQPQLSLGEVLGEGGTATVYELIGAGEDQVLKVIDTRTALSFDRSGLAAVIKQRKMRERCITEIETLRELADCPNIVQIRGFYEYVDPDERHLPEAERSGSSIFLIQMDQMRDFYKYTADGRHPVTEAMLVELARDMCSALAHCHAGGILHRDVKPHNIFVIEKDGRLRFVLGDFGCCRRLQHSNSCVTRLGTDAFAAPEILAGRPLQGFNSDIYSLGATLFYILTNGSFPKAFYDSGLPLPELPGISEDFCRIIMKAAAFDPAERYQSAVEMLKELQDIAEPSLTHIIPGSPMYSAAKNALLNGDDERALELAKNGCREGDQSCARLAAYIIYRSHRDDPAQVRAVLDQLEMLMYEGDATAKSLYGIILYNNGDTAESMRHLKDAAEEGCIIAKYLYGRLLFEGRAGLTADRAAAGPMLYEAALAAYLPALRFFTKLQRREPTLKMPQEILRMLPISETEYSEHKREDLLRFL